MSMLNASKKRADEALTKNLKVERNYASKHEKKRLAERYGKYAEAAKQTV